MQNNEKFQRNHDNPGAKKKMGDGMFFLKIPLRFEFFDFLVIKRLINIHSTE